MNNRLTISLIVLLLLTSCTELKTKYLDYKYTHLLIQTKLTDKDKKFYEKVETKFQEIAKDFAYQYTFVDSSLEAKRCKELSKLYKAILDKPVSKEGEIIKNRIFELSFYGCTVEVSKKNFEEIEKNIVKRTKEEAQYIYNKIPDTAIIYNELSSEKFSFKNTKNLARNLFKSKLDTSPVNNLQFAYITNKKKSIYQNKSAMKKYCEAAVEKKQWDRIYFLTKERDSACGKQKAHEFLCPCPQAMNLVEPYWPYVYRYKDAE